MEKKALVLSGGGALGAYEAGVLKAFKKLKIEFDLVTGTSVGALNAIMVVQKDVNKCLKVWKNISFANIYEDKIDDNISLNNLYKKHAKELFKNGGMNPIMLEKLVRDVYEPKKFYASEIDYGLITFNVSTMKPKKMTKKKIPAEKLVDYAVASATCFPAFKIKTIDNEKYIDGGFYDNLPIGLAVEMGATEIIAVDLQALGLTKRVNNFNGKITIIKPNNKLMDMLEFNKTKARRAIKLGYNDTLKKYHKLDGYKLTFKRNHLIKNYERNIDKFIENINKHKITDLFVQKFFVSDKNFKKSLEEFNKVVESCGLLFELDDTKIYNINSYNILLHKRLKSIKSLNLKDKRDYNQIKNIFDKKVIVKSIYNLINKDTKNKKIKVIASLFSKEYLIACYLKTVKENSLLIID